MIRDVAELRATGRVRRRVAELGISAASWRAGMRQAACREGMRIRTFLAAVHPSDAGEHDELGEQVVYAVRIDQPADLAVIAAVMDAPSVPDRNRRPATVVCLSDRRPRRAGPAAPPT